MRTRNGSSRLQPEVSRHGLLRLIRVGAAALMFVACFTDFVGDPEPPALTPIQFAVIDAGDEFTCGLSTGGLPYCWGSFVNQGAGYGAEVVQAVPRKVEGNLSFVSLTVGSLHACALTAAGEAYCWGWNSHRQLGTRGGPAWCVGRDANSLAGPCSLTPLRVEGTVTFSQLSAGWFHTCGVTTGGTAYCWGSNESSQLGNVSALPAAAEVCAFGEGFGAATASCAPPLPVDGGLAFASISAGVSHTCALTTAGAGYCWGDSGFDGALGTGSASSSAVPVSVSGGHAFSAIAAGAQHTCGVDSAGSAYGWGSDVADPNNPGEGTLLGTGSFIEEGSYTPVPVAGGIVFTSLQASWTYSCGRTPANAVYCWGLVPDSTINLTPFDVAGTAANVPTPFGGAIAFASLGVGTFHACGVSPGGTGYCWGANRLGQLGDGSRTPARTAVTVAGAVNP